LEEKAMAFWKKKTPPPREPERISGGELLFCLSESKEEVLDSFEKVFGLNHQDGGNQLTLRQGDLEIVLTVFERREEGERGEFAKNQLQGAWSFFRGVKTEQVDIQRNLLFHLRQCKCVAAAGYSYEDAGAAENQAKEQRIRGALLAAVSAQQGLMTSGQTVLMDGAGRVILNSEGASQVEAYFPAEQPLPPDYGADVPEEFRRRKERSMAFLREKGIYVTPWLPFLDEPEEGGHPRTVREVCGRTAALLAVSLYSECLLGEKMEVPEALAFVQQIIDQYGADQYFSPRERAYLGNPDSTEQERAGFSWQYETLLMMEWALGLVEELSYPDGICDVPMTVRRLREFHSLSEMEAGARPRTRRELLDAADLIYRMDWACVDARVNGFPAPAGLDGGVVMERHHALFWLAGCDGGCDWDDVDLST